MTVAKNTLWSRWVPVLISAIMLLINLVVVGVMWGRLEMKVQQNREHAMDKDVHMPLTKKEDHFVTRREYLLHLEAMTNIYAELKVIKEKVEKL